LIDYAGVTAGPSRSELGTQFDDYLADPGSYHFEIFWGSSLIGDTGLPSVATVAGAIQFGMPIQFRGIIQRADWAPPGNNNVPPGNHRGFAKTVSFAKVTDGSSKTLIASEKRVVPSLYEGGPVSDNAGWADGWDYDNLRSTMYPVEADAEDSSVTARFGRLHYQFGSAHPGGINALFADGSVTGIRFDVDGETFNRLGHRSDGESIREDF
jgi:prepilin-type processing-associated H-X9-DG protein